MGKLKVLDLFSGIGGFSVGLEKTNGFETVAFCELDQRAHQILQRNWPNVPIFNDVMELNNEQLHAAGVGRIDVVCGGFPVRTSAPLGMVQDSPENAAGSGSSTPESLENSSPSTPSLKTSPTSESVDLASCFRTLPAWGTMRIGRSSRPHLSAHRISVTASGSSQNVNGSLLSSVLSVLTKTQAKNPSAATAARILESVIASGRLQQKTPDGNVLKRIGALLPTPTVQDGENNAGPAQYSRNTYPLNVIAGTNMNPHWVAWLMGFPAGHI